MISKLISNVEQIYYPEKLIDKMALINWVKRTNSIIYGRKTRCSYDKLHCTLAKPANL